MNNERDRPHGLTTTTTTTTTAAAAAAAAAAATATATTTTTTTTTTTGIIGKPKPDDFKIPSPIGGRDNNSEH